ncbi:MAG: hypothetical protein ACI8RZ_001244 [Myxococcota bacterium]|jgi:hypothetical protein
MPTEPEDAQVSGEASGIVDHRGDLKVSGNLCRTAGASRKEDRATQPAVSSEVGFIEMNVVLKQGSLLWESA